MMVRKRLTARSIAGAVSLAALAAAFLLPEATAAVTPSACGLTTLDGAVRGTDSGLLRCGPGDPLAVRQDLAMGAAGRQSSARGLLAFVALGNLHVTDEESPLRHEFADACGDASTAGSFRPHETMLPALANAHIRAAAALASSGSPALDKTYDFAVQLGNVTDNRQLNEIRWAIDLLDGGGVVDPDSGAEGYEGSQSSDPRGGSAFTSPSGSRSLRELANDPFFAQGLRTASGSPLPWYSVIGNHDVKSGGQLPDDAGAREAANAVATGTVKASGISPDDRERLCDDPTLASDPTFLQRLLLDPTATTPKVVSADADRRIITRSQWMAEHNSTRGLPRGHGFASGRCTDTAGTALGRACYGWDQGPFHMVVLDTVSSEPGTDGDIDPGQLAWLERDLIAASSTYFDADGKKKTTGAADRLVIVFSHHATDALTVRPGSSAKDGAALEALLLRFPNVVLHVNGSAHGENVVPHQSRKNKTAFWELNAGSAADWPTRSRSIEIADNQDGTLSIHGIQFEAAAGANARSVSWSEDDPTEEKALGSTRNVNEGWLAAAAREIAFNDPQAETGTVPAKQRNVELLLKHPFGVTKTGTIVPPPVRDFPSFQPGFPGGFKFPTDFNGFPGGTPQQPFDPSQFPTGQQYGSSDWHNTQPGLSIKPSSANTQTPRILFLLIAAAGGAYWLAQARVRRWMVGI